MIPSTPVLWRFSLIAGVLACCSLIPLVWSIVEFVKPTRNATYFVLIFYGACTWVFAATGFAIVFKKATGGSFGWSERYLLEVRYKFLGFAALIFFCMDVMALFGDLKQGYEPLFVAMTSINAWMALLLCRLTFLQNEAIDQYVRTAILTNSHDGVQISFEDAKLLYRFDCERAIVENSLHLESRSRIVEALECVHLYQYLRLQHKIRALMIAADREKHWRASDLLSDLSSNISGISVDETKADVIRRLADQPQLQFPCSRDAETGLAYVNKTFGEPEELEDVD